jgi:hypothetical protein
MSRTPNADKVEIDYTTVETDALPVAVTTTKLGMVAEDFPRPIQDIVARALTLPKTMGVPVTQPTEKHASTLSATFRSYGRKHVPELTVSAPFSKQDDGTYRLVVTAIVTTRKPRLATNAPVTPQPVPGADTTPRPKASTRRQEDHDAIMNANLK